MKKPRAVGDTITSNLKRAVWDVHVGSGIKEATCQLCGIRKIYAVQNSGFECAHIVARKWLANEPLTIYYLYPSCTVCNNECASLCLLDYLYVRERIAPLRRLIMSLYECYVTEHKHELAQDQRQAQLVIRHLYARPEFLEGGLQNVKQVCELARQEQLELLRERISGVVAELGALTAQIKTVADAEIKPLQLLVSFPWRAQSSFARPWHPYSIASSAESADAVSG